MAGEMEPVRLRSALCVIPDEDTFDLLRHELLDHGYRADRAASASDALAAARAGDYDIYIIDNWWLTDGDGIELCREIRRYDAATPILFYSGNVFPSEIVRALDAGAQDYIVLPDLAGQLPGRVDELVEAAETRNREAFLEETRSIREQLSERLERLDKMKQAAEQHLDHALQEVLRAHALADFIKAGGKRAVFDQLWPKALKDAVGSSGPRYK